MSRLKNARHFHAGKLRKTIDGLEYIDVAESNGKVFVSRAGLLLTPSKPNPHYGTLMKNGYYEVSIASRSYTVHRVVAEVYLGEIPPGMEVDHIDTDPKNNSVKNLCIVTSKENTIVYKRRMPHTVKLLLAYVLERSVLWGHSSPHGKPHRLASRLRASAIHCAIDASRLVGISG